MIRILKTGEESIDSKILAKRIPRTLFALIAGMSLSISGVLMQSLTKNPIADPSILGINTGASFGVVFAMAYLKITSYYQFILFALLGSTLAAILVFMIASGGKSGLNPIKLVISGAAISAGFSSIIKIILLPRQNIMSTFKLWQIGSISAAEYESLLAIIPFVLLAIIVTVIISPKLDILVLGDEIATGLGVNVKQTRLIATITSVVFCAVITAIAGPIAFLGLMVPNIVRAVIGSDIKRSIVYSALFGSLFLTVSDICGRLLGAPGELEVGIITSFIGAPVLIFIVMKNRYKAI